MIKMSLTYEMSLLCSHPQYPVQKYDYWDKTFYESENDVYTVLYLFSLATRLIHCRLLFVCTSDSSRVIMIQL